MIRNPVGLQVRSYTSILDLQTHAHPPVIGQTTQTCINYTKQSGTCNEGEGWVLIYQTLSGKWANIRTPSLNHQVKKCCPLIFRTELSDLGIVLNGHLLVCKWSGCLPTSSWSMMGGSTLPTYYLVHVLAKHPPRFLTGFLYPLLISTH